MRIKPTVNVSLKLRQLLNDALALEMSAAIQYMWQHVQCVGVQGIATRDRFREIAIAEMRHAEAIADRLFYLLAIPTTIPAPIFVGVTLKEFLISDIRAEEQTIMLYRQIIFVAEAEADTTTAHLFREILQDEEEHHDLFTALSEENNA